MRSSITGRWPLLLLLGLLTLLLTACPVRFPVGTAALSRDLRPTATAEPSQTRQRQLTPVEATPSPTAFATPTPGPTATATPTALAAPDREQAIALTDEARARFLTSDLADAEAKAIEAIAADPSYLPAHIQLTDIYLFMPHYWRQALQAAQAAVALAEDDPIALAYLAWAQQGAHLFDEARISAERAVELAPDDPITQQALADVLSSVYEVDRAYALAQSAVALDRSNAASWATLGSIAYNLEYPDEAGRAYDRAVELEPDFFAWHILLARYELNQTGDAVTALELAQPAIETQPEHPFVLSFLVDVAMETNDWPAAEANCAKLFAYNQPDTPYPDAYSCMAGVKLFEEESDGAAYFQELAEAIAPPQRRDVTVMRMRLLNDDEQCEESRKLAEAWLEERPYSVLALRMIGVSYLCEQEYAKAADYFEQALELLPRSIADARLLANAYARDDKGSEARAALNRVASFAAENPLYYQGLFEMHLYLGQTREAIRAAQRWQVLRPESTDAMTSLALAELFNGNAAAAQSHAQNALDLGAKDSTTYAVLGETYSRAGNFEKAEENLLKALAINPDHFLAHNFAAQLYLLNGLCDEAETHIAWLRQDADEDDESVARYEEFLKRCRERANQTPPDRADALDDDAVLRAAEETLRTAGVRARSVQFAEDETQRSLFVAFSSELNKDSDEFAVLERTIAIELAKLLPRIMSRADGLFVLSGAQDEPQHILFITTLAANRWSKGEISDSEFEETWLKESADILRSEE
ncbi:MAG: tetratricopeptide repeat protein [Caldilineaceae bacterium]|nr:tetratricopeptide repeat protein [Caldilineaceae bacterium]